MRWLLVLLFACGSKAPAPITPKPVVTQKPAPIWPIQMRVMTWTHDGLVQVGTLPDAPARPSTPWFVEPTRELDDALFAKIVSAIRTEHVPGLSLREQPVTAAWLAQLRDLDSLVLDDTDVDLAMLQGTQLSLKRLYLARTRIRDDAFAWISTQPLEALDVEDCAITTLQLPASLKAINASGTKITDAVALGPNLEVVDLGRTAVGAKTVEALSKLPVKQLFLDRTRADRSIAKLAALAPTIERIDLSTLVAYLPTDADMAWIANAPNLEEVGLSKSRVTDKTGLLIAALPNLKEVRLAETPITAKTIDKLVVKDLLEVDLAQTPVTDAHAATLLALPNLRMLRLDRTSVSKISATNPALVELYLSGTKVTDATLALPPKLEALGLGDTAIGDQTLDAIAKLGDLETLVLSKTHANHYDIVGKLTKLERLYLDGTHVDSSVVQAIQAPRLRVLHIDVSDVEDDALPAMRKLSQLRELATGDTRMKNQIADLSAWPHLETLSLLGLQIGDADLPQIANARSLARLDLSSTDITDPTPLANLPNLVELGLQMTRLSPKGKAAAKALAKRGISVVQ